MTGRCISTLAKCIEDRKGLGSAYTIVFGKRRTS